MLGSDPTYNMSDIVRYLSYPYVAYQIINADRLDVVYQAIKKGLYPRYPQEGGSARRAPGAPLAPTMPDAERIAAREHAERRAAEDR